ncbi:hypothetical protein B0H67DRAFT_554878 [Lasiosphaeris hirsuta]|uniref:Tail specific protease domain-containing protein n=1 Tax=Lasiosphaeris hirsuta TaxID=260670 RepID=A0AA40A7S1_9PEZI|nr:hypothetical protein B0H67DRAFT_554878 [Lasiosphaeris hirsuta]
MLFREALWALALTRASTAHVIRRQDLDPSAVSSAFPSETVLESVAFSPSIVSETSAPAPTSTALVGKGCTGVSGLATEAKASDPDATVFVPPSLALSCLESVPVDVERDIGVIEYFLPYVSFQSTLGYLKKPPQGYLLPGVDVIGGLVAIREKLRKGGYKNQFEWGLDVKRAFGAAADGHFSYSPAILSVFGFQRTLNITSVSSDGLELPKIYDVDDIVRLGIDSASEIVSIDDTPVQDFVGKVASEKPFQDPDAQLNFLFWSIPTAWNGDNSPAFMSARTLPDSHTVKFANGTIKEYPNQAVVSSAVDFDKITSGDDLHESVEIPPPPGKGSPGTPTRLRLKHIYADALGQTETETEVTPSAAPSATAIPGYPEPIVIHQSGYVSGYFLNGSAAHDDTCVLVLSSFAAPDDSLVDNSINAEYEETRRVFQTFFKECAAAGRTKLILDVSGNGGGLVMQGYDLYKNLFPDNKAWSGSRLRAHTALDLMGQNSYEVLGGEQALLTSIFLNPITGKSYPKWKDMFGPAVFAEDKETNIMIYDFANKSMLFDPSTETPFSITGFDPDNPAPTQPFAKEDIVVLTDGYCASTCTVLVGLLQREAGVRTIVVGGRPLVAPMQAVGGVKGSQVLPVASIQQQWETIITNQSVVVPQDLVSALPKPSNSTPPLMPIDLSKASVNYRNAYPEDNQDGPPTQFVYEAANCRRFYRPEYLADIQAEWRDVADIAWHGAKCAPGSTVSADGKIDSKVPAYSDAVRSKQSIYDGPGSLTNAEWLALATNLTGTTEGIASGAGRRGVELSVGVVAAVLVSALLML